MVNPTDSGVTTVSPKDFRKLKVAEMDQTGLTFIIGKRGTGKTRLVCDLAYNWYMSGMRCKRKMPDGTTQNYQRKLDMVLCFSPTELIKQDFKVFVPSAFRYPKFKENVVNDLVARQKAVLEKEGGEEKCQRVLLIIDDCAFEKNFFKTEIMRFIAMNLRHYNVHVIITVQYALDVPPAIRQNIDYCFCLHDNSNSNKKRYWEHFYGQIQSQRDFNSIFDALTNDYSCMVGCNGVQSSTLTDTLFWYKGDVKLPAEFRIGRPAYWRLSDTTQIERPHNPADHHDGQQQQGTTQPTAAQPAASCVKPMFRAIEDAPRADMNNTNQGEFGSHEQLQQLPRRTSFAPTFVPNYGTSNSGSSNSGSSRSSSSNTHGQTRAQGLAQGPAQNQSLARKSSRVPFQHSGSSMVRRSHSTLPVEIVVSRS
jgi:hypothetical protein